MDNQQSQHAVEKSRGTLWLVWLIPLVALIMAGWLIYKHYAEKGIDIVVIFNSGKGFETDKTPLLYQGIKIGTVTAIEIDPKDLHKVRTTITIAPNAARYVTRKGTKFIKVEPKVSLTEVTGLDTILSGVYIDLYPAGRTKKEILAKPEAYTFEGLDHYPPKRYEKGLYLTLKSKKATINLNAPVIYKGFIVGKIIDKRLEERDVVYTAFIENRYADLIDGHTRFWKINGIDLRANLAGVKVKIDSLATVLAGGVAFETPEISPASKERKESYTLYESKLDSNLDKSVITLVSDKAYNIDPNFSGVFYKGFKIGKIVDLHYDTEKSQTVFKIQLAKRFAHLANEKAWFWIVRPVVNIREVKGLDAILGGPYIALDTTEIHAPKKKRFQLHTDPLPLKGKHIHLAAVHAESIKNGTTIFYKEIPVGQISKVHLIPGRKSLDIDAVIFDKYTGFMNDSSMFYVKSGFEMQMSLRETHIESGSLETMIVGGVTMVTPDPGAPKTKDHFFLYKNFKTFKKARYLKSGGTEFHVLMKNLGSLTAGAPVLYRKLKAGEIVAYRYLPQEDVIDVSIFIEKEFRKRINRSTRFRNVSGVEFRMSFPDVKVRVDSLETLIAGGLVFETPDPNAPNVKQGHRFLLYDDALEHKLHYHLFELWMSQSLGIKAGTKLLYKGVPVGKVDRLVLMNNMIKAEILIKKEFVPLLRSDSILWLKRFKGGLSGIENLSNALTGPAIVLAPGRSETRSDSFTLAEHPPPPTYGKTGLRIVVEGDRRGSLDIGAPLYYRQVPIGQVESWVLSNDGTSVQITLFVEPRYAHLIRDNAKFYMAGAFGMEVNLMGVKIQTETLQTLISGGIGMVVPDPPGSVVPDKTHFKLFNEPDPAWLAWKPKL